MKRLVEETFAITAKQAAQALAKQAQEGEILSNVVDEISFDSWKEPLRGLF